MNPLQMEGLLKRLENLPTLPGIALRILEAVKNENTNLDDLGKILSLDPPLAGKILGLINSAFYALPVKVTSVSHADCGYRLPAKHGDDHRTVGLDPHPPHEQYYAQHEFAVNLSIGCRRQRTGELQLDFWW